MTTEQTFLAGVIEGFYGPPWTQAERLEVLEWLSGWGLNTYLYAPKDDLKHRAIWREPYSESEAAAMGRLIAACRQRQVEFVYALSPGLDIRYTAPGEIELLKKRFEQMLGLGCRHFCLLFDDIPDRMNAADLERWGSLAAAQAWVTNEMFRWTRERQAAARFLFCPTPYCGRMAERQHGGADYLPTIGRELLPEIEIFWTGPEIISREISVAHIREVQGWLRRKPLIWDNLHANDYDGRRFFCGPYAGRPAELRGEVSGLLTNPNTEFALNFVPIRRLAAFVNSAGSWDARAAYLAAMEEWRPRFETVTGDAAIRDLVLLGDCYYLPYGEGPGAEALFESAREMLAAEPEAWVRTAAEFRRLAGPLRDFCARLPEVRHRPVFHALSRRIWELREELELLDRLAAHRLNPETRDKPFASDFHLPRTYRGGIVARLQRLLHQEPDGTFRPNPTNPR